MIDLLNELDARELAGEITHDESIVIYEGAAFDELIASCYAANDGETLRKKGLEKTADLLGL